MRPHRSHSLLFATALALGTGHAAAGTDEGYTIAFTLIVPFAFNSASFRPDDAQREALTDAAHAALVAVRARTSNVRLTASDEALALARALAARRYLMEHGVSASKITINFVSGGDYLADNNTAQGRALNRRVEIEMFYTQGQLEMEGAAAAAATRGD